MWLITEHRKSLSTEKDSGSPAVNNLIIIFLQLHLKHYFKWLCSHFYHPHSSSCVAEGGRPTAGDFCTYCQPAPGTAPAQKTTWVDVVCWKKYTQMPWHQVKSSPILTDPQGMTPEYCYQYSKESSDWKNLQFIWSGILLRSCFGAPNLHPFEQECQKSGSASWPWHPAMTWHRGLCGSATISPELLGLSRVTKIFVGLQQGKNHTEDENQQNL